MTDTPAPLSELRVAAIVRRYERVKLFMLSVVLIITSVTGTYLVGLAGDTRDSLTILRCAVSKEVRTTADGKPTTTKEAQRRFDACLKHGGPASNQP